jgi:phosphonopyruvate decarboxylase
VCLDGDAAAIMHLGALTTTGKIKPFNFLHVVLNNGVHESVGGQPTAGYSARLTAMAENAGYNTVGKAVDTRQALIDAITSLLRHRGKGPAFIDVHISKGIRSDLGSLDISLKEKKKLFMKLFVEELY